MSENPHGHSPDDQHEHDHQHAHGHSHSHGAIGGHSAAPRALRSALVVTALFMVVEAVGGWISGSLALLSDAAHMLTDVGALALSLGAQWIAAQKATRRMSYGYQRAEILGALISGLVIWFLAGALIFEAIERFQSPAPIDGKLVFWIAGLGLIANLVSMRFLHASHTHNLNVKAAYLHVATDAISSIGVMISGGILMWTGWLPIDPLISILASLLMLWSAWGLVKESIDILMESTPRGIDPDAVEHDLSQVPGVAGVHDLHIWQLSSGLKSMSAHLITHPTLNQAGTAGVLTQAKKILRERYAIEHSTLQIEAQADDRPCDGC